MMEGDVVDIHIDPAAAAKKVSFTECKVRESGAISIARHQA